ncbi:hypothetical protein [Myroides sp. DF42-4-2]|uniref:hypothetical protein n=1 Tax=unclassified Myroides TaxID=2642485 RepID=UPI002576A430|nr:hypothetical protein [Myroides sp. DF42-4-2]MDM1407520.1 hypothetical protein [Myroides sp. DF42-4-2]
MKLKEGDLFEIKIAEDVLVYGQIVSTFKKKAFSIVCFVGTYDRRPEVKDIINKEVLLFGNTFDAKFYHGDWVVFTNEKSNLPRIKMPYYKIGTDSIYVEDFFENRIRKASKEDINRLRYRNYIAPIRFESALKAYYNYIDWDNLYDDLLYNNLIIDI